MKKVIIRIGVLLVILAASVYIFASVFNRGETVNTTDLTSASLPVLYMESSGVRINPMKGYREAMQEATMRDSVTPMDTQKKLTVVVDTQGESVEGLSYTVTSPDGTEVLENRKLSLTSPDEEGCITVEFSPKAQMLLNQEYCLSFMVTLSGDDTAYYYTRVLQRNGINTSQYLTFVDNFYRKCTDKQEAKSLTDSLEPDNSQQDNDLSHVDIHSSFERITWGDLNPSISREAVPVIREINETTCSITLDYGLTATDDEEVTENYNVHEFYRMRYANSRVMLLNFEREANELFNYKSVMVSEDSLPLGILADEDSIVTDEDGNIAAFTQGGELFTFSRTSCRLSRIFSFQTGDDTDNRENDQEHMIRIMRVNEAGDVDYLVCGYMSADRYEGQNGVLVYHYDAATNISTEQLFIPCSVSYECLSRDLEEFSYVSTGNILYMLIEGTLYKVDLNTGEQTNLLENIDSECFVSSDSGRSIAWMKQMEPMASTEITMMDLETEQTYTVRGDSGYYLRTLGFLNEDLVYGTAKEKDITKHVFAMYSVKIMNISGTVKKEYKKKNVWVTGATVTPEYIELQRVKKSSGSYSDIDTDKIVNNAELNSLGVDLLQTEDERQGIISVLSFEQPVSGTEPVLLETKYSASEEERELVVEFTGFPANKYQIYADGKLAGLTSNVSRAVQMADEKMGVVLNKDQQYIWERGNQKETSPANVSALPSGILSAIPDSVEAMQSALGDGYTALDLSGCTLSEVLYMVSQGRAVAADTANGFVLIVGYDYYNVILYDPDTEETYYGGMNDSTALFEASGNVFISYIENLDQN